jgi:hypothetical protein
MKNLISKESPQALIDAYLTNATFHAVVAKHENSGSEYVPMLEEAVSLLVQELAAKNELALKYARRYGPINDGGEAKDHIGDEKKALAEIVESWWCDPSFYTWRHSNQGGQNNGEAID